MVSYAAQSGPMQLFQPSKYDLLDQEVAKVIDAVGFDGFVSRLDEPVKRGQRVPDHMEWKGEFLFGAGEKVSGVKLLKLQGRAAELRGTNWKVMIRVGGAWVDLADELRRRRENPKDDVETF
ncbi:hypothetical protein TREMEDRAFT_57027 [Tremella mesenterica DSM 1558]|uniref:uncharacterized protein n=1 Tax=Tremella mesenterica (strain ATCC 24925 / CBS 8224 / DSM 1558 / NBRC 9311 / NRRL Y-6157 / RJB 2259-6 / UBC 559-6) TaxID=578456 RepID=UPI0003F49699|nr:uncharacterized protein TREMEDRAFT_57027 [Tremella mesenterica DSM 1558]EIW68870.1 hypothetical protein TREMEDRAFT_57027 [Tremella mesenterica DSM 1558]